MLFVDESGFARVGFINSHNLHIWSNKTPHVFMETKKLIYFQHTYYWSLLGETVHMWRGITRRKIFGTFTLRIKYFLRKCTFKYLGSGVDHGWRCSSAFLKKYLNNTCTNRWIGRGDAVVFGISGRQILFQSDKFQPTLVYWTTITTIRTLWELTQYAISSAIEYYMYFC